MKLLDFLFPKKCVGCNKLGAYFCPGCILNINQEDLVCPFCERASIGGVTHPVCRRKFGLDGLWSLGVYNPPLRDAIQKLKYKWVVELGDILTNIVIEYWARYPTVLLDQIRKSQGKGWIVVPVPLHWTRQNWRGFNQSALFAQSLAQKMGLKYHDCLKRIRATKPQVKLEARDRRQNVKNAFSFASKKEMHNTGYLIHNTNVLLVDDVWTTGSTLKECCYALKRNGAQKVWALTLAR